MKSFYEFTELMEAGVAGMKFMYCPECSKNPGYRAQKIDPWVTRVQRCKLCGAGLYEKNDVVDNLAVELQRKIAELTADEEIKKGVELSALIDQGNPPEEVYAHMGITPEEAERLMDKSAIVGVYKRKLAKLPKE